LATIKNKIYSNGYAFRGTVATKAIHATENACISLQNRLNAAVDIVR
jgi:hypothetical protein